jgi:hypothetical protein
MAYLKFMPSKLDQTYANYKQAFRNLNQQANEIRVKLAALEEAGAVDPGDKQESLPLNDAAETPAEDEPNLTERAFQIVNALPESVTVRRIDVGMKMRKDGYVPNGKNFPVTLFKTLIRLKDQGRIGGEKRGGIWEFFAVK